MINGDEEQTDNGTIEKYCYDDVPENCAEFGGLYQWDEAMKYVTTERAQGICPPGWHMPTNWEFQSLESYESDVAARLVDLSQTTSGYTPTNGTGFSALFAGFWDYSSSSFSGLGDATPFWTSEERSSEYYYYMALYFNSSSVHTSIAASGGMGFSVRCLKD